MTVGFQPCLSGCEQAIPNQRYQGRLQKAGGKSLVFLKDLPIAAYGFGPNKRRNGFAYDILDKIENECFAKSAWHSFESPAVVKPKWLAFHTGANGGVLDSFLVDDGTSKPTCFLMEIPDGERTSNIIKHHDNVRLGKNGFTRNFESSNGRSQTCSAEFMPPLEENHMIDMGRVSSLSWEEELCNYQDSIRSPLPVLKEQNKVCISSVDQENSKGEFRRHNATKQDLGRSISAPVLRNAPKTFQLKSKSTTNASRPKTSFDIHPRHSYVLAHSVGGSNTPAKEYATTKPDLATQLEVSFHEKLSSVKKRVITHNSWSANDARIRTRDLGVDQLCQGKGQHKNQISRRAQSVCNSKYVRADDTLDEHRGRRGLSGRTAMPLAVVQAVDFSFSGHQKSPISTLGQRNESKTNQLRRKIRESVCSAMVDLEEDIHDLLT